MNSLITFLNTTGKSFVDFAGPMLIQSSLLIIVLFALDLLLRKKVRAVFRYCIWMLILVKLVLPTTLSSPTSLGYWFADKVPDIITQKPSIPEHIPPVLPHIEPAAENTLPLTTVAASPPSGTTDVPVANIPTEYIAAPSPPTTASLSWHGFAFLGWLAAVIAMALLLIQRMFFVKGLLGQSKNPNDSMLNTFEQCRKKMKTHSRVTLKLSPITASPSVCGLFRPTILIPHNLPSKLNTEDLKSILLHELAHIKRGDLWINLAQALLQIAYFYNPLLWVANAIIRRIREQAVDEMVLVAMGARAENYPQTLLNISRLTFSRPALSLRLIGVVESKKALTSRIKHILSRPFPKSAKLGFVGLITIIIAAAVLLPMAKSASKPPEFVIKGTVTDAQTGQPIAGAKVGDIEEYADGRQWTTTDSNGNYEYKTWSEEHNIKSEAAGYKRQDELFYKSIGSNEKEKVIHFELTPEKPAVQSEFKADLPNGVTVELVGVCEHPSQGKQWWRPDGNLLLQAPYESREGQPIKNRNKKTNRLVEFAISFVGEQLPYADVCYKVPGATRTSGGGDVQPTPQGAIKSIACEISKYRDTAEVRLGVASGKWKTITEYDGSRGGFVGPEDIVFSDPIETKQGTTIVVRGEWGWQGARRITAIDKNGNTHTGSWRGRSTGLKTLATTEFYDLKPKQIQKYQLQFRPYEWIEFKNVSLKPNLKTDVQIEVEKPAVEVEVEEAEVQVKTENNLVSPPLNDIERGFIGQILDLVKKVESKYPEEATHWPAGPGLYHVDGQGEVTVWSYQRLWHRKYCKDDEVGWGSSRLVNAEGMYYLPDGTPLRSRWSERGGGMKDIRVKIGRPVEENERVAVIHRHRLSSSQDLLSRDENEKHIMLESWKDLPLAIIVRVDKPMRLSGWWLNDIETDKQYFDEYGQWVINAPPGNNDKPIFIVVAFPVKVVEVEGEEGAGLSNAEIATDETEIIKTAKQLFDNIKNAEYDKILSYYKDGKWKRDGWKKILPHDYDYMTQTDFPSLTKWICLTFKENPITKIVVGKVFITDKQIIGKTGWPAVTYKLTLEDESIIQGYLPFRKTTVKNKEFWQPMVGIDWHLRKNPVLDKSYDMKNDDFWTYGILKPVVQIGVLGKMLMLGEDDIVNGLKFCSELSGGRYPSSLDPAIIIKEIQKWTIQKYAESGIDRKTKHWLRDEILKTFYLSAYLKKLERENKSPQYYGDNITASDTDRILLRWKLSKDKYRVIYGDLRKDTIKAKTWDKAFTEATTVIQSKTNWPKTPQAVAQAFWDERAKKNYNEMKILWPGSGSWAPGWDEICKDDSNIKYVFGQASKDGTEVPYASEEHFKKTGSYNLTMRMSSMAAKAGKRHYIWSGN
jgi:beta-lactamase regulating signal transducer with metallopeptidase domain